MATKTIINCLEPTATTSTITTDSAPPGISIIIDPRHQSVASNASNVIKIQHSCPESQLTMTPNNNKTLIDINCNNQPSNFAKSDNDSKQFNSSLASSSSSTSSSLLNVIKVKCLTSSVENNSREMKETEKPVELQLETKCLTNGSVLEIGNLLSAHTEDKDRNDHLCGQEKEKSLANVKQELTKLSKESGQTSKSMSSTSVSYISTTATTNTTTTSTTTTTTSQQVNGNSKYRENNGHSSINQTNGQDALNNNEDNDSQHHHHHLHHDHEKDHDHLHGRNDLKPAVYDGSGKRVVSDGGAFVGHDGKHAVANGNAHSLLTKADTATTQLRSTATAASISKLTLNENLSQQNGNIENCNLNEENHAHVVKIQINQKKSPEKQISIVKIENLNKNQNPTHESKESTAFQIDSKQSDTKDLTIVNKKSELNLQIQDKMVQKPFNTTNHHHQHQHQQHHPTAHAVTISAANPTQSLTTASGVTAMTTTTTTTTSSNASTGSTTITELNVTNPNYLYYMMSSGQFSPCDTLDSGTGSDLETQQHSSQSPINGHPMLMKKSSNGLEMHLKTTKIRVSNSTKEQRNCSFTDSEESEASSLSCDSLHSSEFIRQSSSSPIQQTKTPSPSSKILGSYLPDSLLRDIKNLKFSNTEYEAENENENDEDDEEEQEIKKQRTKTLKSLAAYETISSQDYLMPPNDYVQTRNSFNNATNNSSSCNNTNSSLNFSSLSASLKRASLPSKTFVLNQEDGTFIDTKMNSMPRKYEADKYYNFHVNEHENFRSFGNNSNMGMHGGVGSLSGDGDGGDSLSLSEYDPRSMQDDVFAGYKDIRCGSATSTIRSSKGTVRGVKNRVRNGIATFLQLQQPNVKNYKEKDSGKVVLYTTSMGIIRDTYAKCSNVKQILRTLLVKFEERDVFMSVEYQQEIKERMHSEIIKVPQLFVEGQHIGDADTVERLNESGELRQLLKPYKSISTTYTCQTCGGYRLLPCPSCNGSKKSVHRNHFTAEFVALKCMNCDEVGLVKCHNC